MKKAKLHALEGTVLAEIIQQIENEVDNQVERWGIQNKHPETWVTILTEEMGEIAKATLEHKPDDLKSELVQVAAVCISALYAMNVNEPD